MRVVKYLILALAFLVILFFVVGQFLPSKRTVTREIEIDRPVRMVFKNINSMHQFNRWSPWADLDSQAEYTFSGPEYGVGSTMRWSGNDEVGSGEQTIVASEKNQSVTTSLQFGDEPNPSTATLKTIAHGDDKTLLVWTFETELNDTLARYFGLMLEDMLGPMYEKGLRNLKALSESQKLYDFSRIELLKVEGHNMLYVERSAEGSMQNLSRALAQAYQTLMGYIHSNDIGEFGRPMAITRHKDDMRWDFAAAIEVDIDSIDTLGEVRLGRTHAGKALRLVQQGPYEQIAESLELLRAYMQEYGLKANGDLWEVYVSDPAEVASDEIITHIYQPVK